MTRFLPLLLLLPTYSVAQTYPQLPDPNKIAVVQNNIDSYVPGPCNYTVANMAELQAAALAATAGQTVCLVNGNTFSGGKNLVLTKNNGTQFITFRPVSMSGLPPAGTRVAPSDAANMPHLKIADGFEAADNTASAFCVKPGARGYRFIGLEVWADVSEGVLVRLGTASSIQGTNALVPRDIVIDRCYIHGIDGKLYGVGVNMDADYVAIINSYIAVHDGDGDNQAVLSINANGPSIIRNNYLEASGENVMFGGGDPNIPYANPCDSIIEGNYFFKDPAKWGNTSWYAVKNLFELKTGCRIMVRGNTFENDKSGVSSQYFAIVFKNSNQGASCGVYPPDTGYLNETHDVTFAWNKIDKIPQGFVIGRKAVCDVIKGTNTLYIHDNLITNLGSGHTQNANPVLFQWSYPLQEQSGELVYPRRITITHNTVGSVAKYALSSNRYQYMEGPDTQLVYEHTFHSNIVTGQWYVSGTTNSESRINLRYKSPFVTKNNLSIHPNAPPFSSAPNWGKADFSGLFVNQAGGDFHLTSASTAAYPGADGRPAGVDITALDLCTLGSKTSWKGTCPGTPPSFAVNITANNDSGPISVAPGANVSLKWVVTGAAVSCVARASNSYGSSIWNGNKSTTGGAQVINPTAGSTYFIDCTNAAGTTVSSGVTVNVITQVLSVDIKANGSDGPTISIPINSSVTLQWTATLASLCTARASTPAAGAIWTGSKDPSGGTQIIIPTSSATYYLDCTDGTDKVTDQITINVSNTSLSATLTANNNSSITIAPGANATMKWVVTGASGCNARASTDYGNTIWTGPKSATGGTQIINPVSTATYYIDCNNTSGDTVTASVIINVTTPIPAVTLKANGSTTALAITPGTPITMEWIVTGAILCEARSSTPYGNTLWFGEKNIAGGSEIFNPLASVTYYLDCSNANGASASSSITVQVAGICNINVGIDPGIPRSPGPATGSTGISLTPQLTWVGDIATSFDVYFGTTNPPPGTPVATVLDAAYAPTAPLAQNTTYYWRVVGKNGPLEVTGPVWNFKTLTTITGSGIYVDGTVAGPGTGTALDPFKTIQQAAEKAIAGQTVTVLPGTYREWIKPFNSGTAANRITYQASGTVIVKGSEIIPNAQWTETPAGSKVYKSDDIAANWWRTVQPAPTGGWNPGSQLDSNPYDKQDGNQGNIRQRDGYVYKNGTVDSGIIWLTPQSMWVHRGQVYIDADSAADGGALLEVPTKAEMQSTAGTWWGEVNTGVTNIWFHLPSAMPSLSGHTVEINVRRALFDASRWNGALPPADHFPDVSFITVHGFRFRHAATPWSTSVNGIGAVTIGLSEGWIVENNEISDAKCSCLATGDRINTLHGNHYGPNNYMGPLATDFKYGNHIIRNNIIQRCGVHGIWAPWGLHGSLVEKNLIQDINYQRLISGVVNAAIKLTVNPDAVIRNNVVRRVRHTLYPNDCSLMPVVWLDFEDPGARITGNIFYDYENQLVSLEKQHGPILLDNNVFIKTLAGVYPPGAGCNDNSGQIFEYGSNIIFAHNLMVGGSFSRSAGGKPRVLTPHTSDALPAGNADNGGLTPQSRDNWYANNIFVQTPNGIGGQKPGDFTDYNVWWINSHKPAYEGSHAQTNNTFDPQVTVTDLPKGAKVTWCADPAYTVIGPVVSGDAAQATLVGRVPDNYLVAQTIENHDGSKITINTDIHGDNRPAGVRTAGPLKTMNVTTGDCTTKNIIQIEAAGP